MISLVKVKWDYVGTLQSDIILLASDDLYDVPKRLKEEYGNDLHSYHILPLTEDENFSIQLNDNAQVLLKNYVDQGEVFEFFPEIEQNEVDYLFK